LLQPYLSGFPDVSASVRGHRPQREQYTAHRPHPQPLYPLTHPRLEGGWGGISVWGWLFAVSGSQGAEAPCLTPRQHTGGQGVSTPCLPISSATPTTLICTRRNGMAL